MEQKRIQAQKEQEDFEDLRREQELEKQLNDKVKERNAELSSDTDSEIVFGKLTYFYIIIPYSYWSILNKDDPKLGDEFEKQPQTKSIGKQKLDYGVQVRRKVKNRDKFKKKRKSKNDKKENSSQ